MILMAIRKTIQVGRYAKRLYSQKNVQTTNPVSTVVSLNLGNGIKVGGMGEMYENFLTSKKISGYVGEDDHFAKYGDGDYEQAPAQIVRYDQTFKKSSQDVRDGNYLNNLCRYS